MLDNPPRTDSTNGTAGLFLLAVVSGSHLFVDLVASQLNPIWPDLKLHYGISSTSGCLLTWMVATSVFQLLFGLIGDAWHSRWLLVAGPAIAVVSLAMISVTSSPWALYTLLLLAGMGVAAYHPEAAAMSGGIWPAQRSRAMSIFSLGGYIGQTLGPYCSGFVVDRWGLPGLGWGALFGLGAVASYGWAIRGVALPERSTATPEATPEANALARSLPTTTSDGRRLSTVLRGGGGWTVALLLTIGSSRVIAAAGVPLAMGYLLQQRDWSKESVGLVQSAFMAGIGLAGLACSIANVTRWERVLLWFPCLLSVPLIVAIPKLDGLVLGAAMTACGFSIGLGLPVFVSTGQRLLPASTRVASSITMGVSWGIGGGIVSLVIGWCEQRDAFLGAFGLFAVAALASCGFCYWIPKPSRNPENLV